MAAQPSVAASQTRRALSTTQIVEIVLLALCGAAWLLVLLARVGWFQLAPLAILPVALAAAAAVMAWWRSGQFSKIAGVVLLMVAAILYLPPAQQLPLSGDAAIYANEGAWLARTGGLQDVHPALAALSPNAADLFYISSDEQIVWGTPVTAYDGLVYGGYYLADASTMTIQSSRMPQVIAWHGFLNLLFSGTSLIFLVSAFSALGSIWMLYAVGVRLYAPWIALWVALLLALCYPQVYLARGSLAETTGAFWTLAGIWFAVLWLQERTPRHLLFALLMWVTCWSGRVDALLLLAPAALLLAIASAQRERKTLRWVAAGAIPLLLLIVLGVNQAYFLATIHLATTGVALLTPALILLAIGAPVAVWVMWKWGGALTGVWQRVDRPVLAIVWLVVCGVVLWATLPGPWRDPLVTRPFQEIIWFSSQYVTPAFYWLAVIGLGVIFWRGLTPVSLFLAGTLAVLAFAYLHGYTSANVYPISLRRLASDLLPMLAIVAGFAFTAPLPLRWYKPILVVAAASVLVWTGMHSAPLLNQREFPNDQVFVRTLHESLPPNAAVLFEPQDADSWIGWLAAPLFSVYGEWALLLESDTPEPTLLVDAVAQLRAAGRTPIIASQSNPLPAALLPEGMQATEVMATTWNSAQVGQARPPEEPVYWQFALPLYLYQLEEAQ